MIGQPNAGSTFQPAMQMPNNQQPTVPGPNANQIPLQQAPAPTPADQNKQWWENIKKSETFAKKIGRSFRTVYDFIA